MTEKLKRQLIPVMLRLDPEDSDRLRDLAHHARLPLAVYCRNLVLGRTPLIAPPAPEELSNSATRLLQICQCAGGNFTQIQTHAAESSDDRLNRLSSENVISGLQERVRNIGMEIKLGRRITGAQIDQHLRQLEAPLAALNDLARALNEGLSVEIVQWGSVLKSIRDALSEALS